MVQAERNGMTIDLVPGLVSWKRQRPSHQNLIASVCGDSRLVVESCSVDLRVKSPANVGPCMTLGCERLSRREELEEVRIRVEVCEIVVALGFREELRVQAQRVS